MPQYFGSTISHVYPSGKDDTVEQPSVPGVPVRAILLTSSLCTSFCKSAKNSTESRPLSLSSVDALPRRGFRSSQPDVETMTGNHAGANGGQFDWDDLRYVLAVAQHGSAGGAARALDVAHATVLRRIQSIEQDFGVRIFDRLPSGLVLTESGRPLLAAAETIDKTILETKRLLAGRTAELEGPLRVTTTDSLMDSLMPSLLQEFRALYPAVVVEVLVTNSKLDLDAMDADLALRAADHPPESWVGRKLARMNYAVYATPAFLARQQNTEWQEMDWLLPESPLSEVPVGRWIARTVDPHRAVFKANSFVTLRRMCEVGLGVAALPCFLGTPSASLRRIELLPDEASTDLWLLTHEDLRRAPRVRAFAAHAAAHLHGHRPLFEGAGH